VEATTTKLELIENDVEDIIKTYQQLVKMVKENQEMFMAIPTELPVKNKNLKRTAAGWGWKIHPIYKIKKFHYGQDFTAPVGTEIYATASGTVSKINYNPHKKNGKSILIDHGNGYTTFYGHLREFKVAKGTTVDKGQVIGLVGNTGRSTAPHLHYEVRYNNEPVNPIYYCFGGLTEAEFNRIIKIAARSNQTFD
jgi:murein DD-endopeptidase MepM/ murein hydrolase activator NlpD